MKMISYLPNFTAVKIPKSTNIATKNNFFLKEASSTAKSIPEKISSDC